MIQLKEEILTMPNVYNQLVQFSRKASADVLWIYRDSAYSLRTHPSGSFKNQNLTS